ncbi:polysaccharide biosynthesis/export family protein [Hyalangium versicolor]|uniref:polysaccharide biosynthesis/export family protein n=1 Tax=Hyalangium versicolor TaxID=2861190 RepID=UPI001CCBD7EC|nr:polysaccharide biosynthesis/export family protein [Hyalangium versicolor]
MMRRSNSSPFRLLPAVLLALAACYTPGRFIWVDDYREPPSLQDEGYIIRKGDRLYIKVWNQNELTLDNALVRDDGRITLPLINDVDAAGLTPPVLARRIEELLKPMVSNPAVTVRVTEPKKVQVAVLGEVKSPGMKELEPGSGVLQALAQAAGFTDYAQQDGIYVLRRQPDNPTPLRIRFNYEAVSRTQGKGAGFVLRTGDVVVVE